jgi:hypothetical protein
MSGVWPPEIEEERSLARLEGRRQARRADAHVLVAAGGNAARGSRGVALPELGLGPRWLVRTLCAVVRIR